MDFATLVKSFKVQPKLHPKFWDKNGNLNPKVRKHLLAIAKNFINSWEFEKPIKIYEIIFTGSLANFNYSKYSDVDVHIIIEYSELNKDESLVEQIFSLLKAKWAEDHDITIYDYEVEVYAEDKNHLHQTTGVYSLTKDKWLKKPSRQHPVYDEEDVISKAKYFENLFKVIQQKSKTNDFEFIEKHIVRMKDKIKKMRQSGLLKGGEFSTENLAFKLLRRNEFFQRVGDFKDALADKNLTLDWITEDFLDEYIRKRGKKWVVLSKAGKLLGSHSSRTSALNQLRAIEANK